MADDKTNDTPSTDPKAGKSAAVKPPVLEGTARPAGSNSSTKSESAKPASSSTSVPPTSSAASKPTSPKSDAPKAQSGAGGGSPWLAGLAGGVLGLGAAYGLAFLGLWPIQPTPAPQPDPRIAQIVSAFPEVSTTTTALEAEIKALSSQLKALEASVNSAPPVQADTSNSLAQDALSRADALAQEVASLSQKLETLANRPEPAPIPEAPPQPDAETTEALARLEGGVTSLNADAKSLAEKLAAAVARIDAIDSALAEARATDSLAARMPLILSGLETAFASGRPYGTELGSLVQALPDQKIPEVLLVAAASGLKRPDVVAREFSEVLPEVMAGTPANDNAEWQDSAADWLRGIVALRPSGEVEGTGPDAIIARIEAALARRDFVAANSELANLPEPMRAAAGSVANDIAALAASETFLAQLRATALTGETAQ